MYKLPINRPSGRYVTGSGGAAQPSTSLRHVTAMSSPVRRLAADGVAYTYAEFERWYGAHAPRMCEGATATAHEPLPLTN